MTRQIQRREFFKRAAATGATTAFTIIPAYAAPRSKESKQRNELPPSERVNVAMVGGGGIARRAFGSLEGHNVVAVCDVAERDKVDEDDPWVHFDGRMGGLITIHSKEDGKLIRKIELTSPPVFDGLGSADNKLFVSCRDGSVLCFE